MKGVIVLFLLLVGPALWGQGRAPEKKPAKSIKDKANDALNATDQGIHKALGAAKEGANDALNAVDKGVHKVVGSDKK